MVPIYLLTKYLKTTSLSYILTPFETGDFEEFRITLSFPKSFIASYRFILMSAFTNFTLWPEYASLAPLGD